MTAVDDRFSRSLAKVHAADRAAEEARYSLSDYMQMAFNGITYNLGVNYTQPGKKQEPITNEYLSMVGAYKSNSVVFSVVQARRKLFSQAVFKYRNETTGRLFGDPSLSLLEKPWPNGTTADLLGLCELAASLGGSAYMVRDGDRLRWLRPDWVAIVLRSHSDPDHPAWGYDAEIIGYIYQPVGQDAGDASLEVFSVEDVAHWTPDPDPTAPWRGMSWLTTVFREIMADSASTDHKLSFFEHGATPNGVIKLPESVKNKAQFDEIREMFETSHAGANNAWKTLYLAAGTEWQQVGMDMTKMDFRALQGHGEVRIANAGGVPASVAGLNEALQGTSLNSGNFQSARRLFADLWAHPQWRSICSVMSKLVTPPSGSRLWYESRDIPFLKDDQLDEANIQQAQAITVMTLVNAGYEPDAAIEYVATNDPSKLSGKHTGLLSVQLQPPGAQEQQDAPDEAEVPDDERTEAQAWAQAANTMTPAVGKVLTEKDARTILAYAGAPVDPNEELPEPPEPPEPPPAPTSGVPPMGESEPEPMEPMDGPDNEAPTAA